jgi:hypothetical protein
MDMKYFYDNPIHLEYLRYHPRWYKILHYEPSMLPSVIEEANRELHLTKRDSLLEFNKKLSFVSSLMQYLAKK